MQAAADLQGTVTDSGILFFDASCQRPYDTHSVTYEATGGTEASLVRVADALGATVVQHNRTGNSGRYRGPGPVAGITRVVLNRDSRALPAVRELYPHARVFLWVHDHFPRGSKRARRLASTKELLSEMSVTLVCVSDEQRRSVESLLRHLRIDHRVRACRIYNPVDDTLAPDGSPVDYGKLAFFSSPNKGLKFALDAFKELRRRMPDLRLVVGNPGYKVRPSAATAAVQFLGPQPQWRIHAEVRTALCTFFPNFLLPETFGLVFAESKALGTPILTHDCGAAAEVIGDPRQLLPVTLGDRVYESLCGKLPGRWRSAPARLAARVGLFDRYAERIAAWRSGTRPSTDPDPRFRLSAIAPEWRALLSA